MDTVEQYDLAISFAGEDKIFADAFDAHLTNGGLKVFTYFRKYAAILAEPLTPALAGIYARQSRFTLVLISSSYLSDKTYIDAEIKAINERRLSQDNYAIAVFIEMDDEIKLKANAKLPRITDTAYFKYNDNKDCKLIVEEIIKKLKLKDAKSHDGRIVFSNNIGTVHQLNQNVGDVINYNN